LRDGSKNNHYENHFVDFYKSQETMVQKKIAYVLDLVRYEKNVPSKFFKSLENSDGIYEVRVITTFKSIRILCFFDQGELVVLTNCFLKKHKRRPEKKLKWLRS
jgi:phage-related protein